MTKSNIDPQSPSFAAAHVLMLLIYTLGGCGIEAVKHSLKPPIIVIAILSIGEITIFVLMLGSLGQAVKWTLAQWKVQRPTTRIRKSSPRYVPTKAEIRMTFKFEKIIIRLLAFLIAFIILLISSALFPLPVYFHYIATYNGKRVQGSEILLLLFNDLSPWILLGLGIFTVLTTLGFIVTIYFNKPKFVHK